jgi:DNA-binding XRE family transcriptional regulator
MTPEEAQMTSRRWEELVFWLTPEDNPPDTAERRTRLGTRLRALRTAYGVTQKDIAPVLQVDRMTLQVLETGEPIARQFEVTLVFAEAFGVAPRDMLCAEHAPTAHLSLVPARFEDFFHGFPMHFRTSERICSYRSAGYHFLAGNV